MDPEEYATYHKMVFREAFDFLNAHFPPGEGAEWWGKFGEDIRISSAKLKGSRLLDGMLVAVADYLEDVYKERRKELEKA